MEIKARDYGFIKTGIFFHMHPHYKVHKRLIITNRVKVFCMFIQSQVICIVNLLPFLINILNFAPDMISDSSTINHA